MMGIPDFRRTVFMVITGRMVSVVFAQQWTFVIANTEVPACTEMRSNDRLHPYFFKATSRL